MKLKHLVISILMIAAACFAAAAQTQVSSPKSQEIAKATTPGSKLATPDSTAAAPVLRAEDLLKVRDLQYKHAARAATLTKMEQQYEQLIKLQEADAQKLDTVIQEAAKASNIDLTKWQFEIEELKFVPRVQSPESGVRSSPPEKEKPKAP